MARITEIRSTSRPIRVKNRTALEYSQNEKYFSIWVQSAGQEGESSLHPLDIQLDREMAGSGSAAACTAFFQIQKMKLFIKKTDIFACITP